MSSRSSSNTVGSQSSKRSIYQSPKDRKEALRSALTKTQSLQEDLSPHALHTLRDVFKEVDEIYADESLDEKIGHQDQIVMDSEVINVSSMIIRTYTQNLTKESNSFDKNEFIDKLLNFVENLPDVTLSEPNWAILEHEIPPFKSTANYTCLLDWMNLSEQPIVVKSKKERNPIVRQRNSQASVQRPDNVVQLEEEEKTIEKTVQQINKLIIRLYKANAEPIDFLKLILDPDDFGKTVENLLHVSFLVRDGRIKLSTDEEETLVITPCSKEMISRAQQIGENSRMQNIVSLEIDQWRILKNTYRLTKPMIDF